MRIIMIFLILLSSNLAISTLNASDLLTPEKLCFKHITSIEGLSNNTVYSITQDEDGFIWIATREGLNKFDGYSITTYYRNGTYSIPGNFVVELLSTSSGRLFVGTQTGVAIYNKKTDSFSTLLYEGGSLGNVRRIFELSDGQVLIATNLGLFCIQKNLEIVKISNLDFRDICEYKTGLIWTLFQDEILLMNPEGEIIRRYNNKNIHSDKFDMSSSNIECIYKDSRGIIWLGTKRDGIGYYNEKDDKFICLNFQKGVNPVEDNFIRVINEDVLGRLWIGTESGLYIYNMESEKFNFYGQKYNPSEEGLNDKAIYSIFRSNDNIMWIGTYFGGVSYTDLFNKGFNRIYADGGRTGLSGNAVSEIIETSDKKIWIGTEDGGINVLDPHEGTLKYFKHINGNPYSLSSNNVHTLKEDRNGNIWIGTFLGGLNKYDARTKTFKTVKLIPSVEEMYHDVYAKSIFSVFIDSKDRIWVGSIGGLFMRENKNEDFRIWNPMFFKNVFVYDIKEDHYHNIWICSYENGIYRIDTAMNIYHYKAGSNHNLLSNRFIFCYTDTSDVIWFGTMEGGLVKYNISRNEFKSYTETDGLPNSTVYAIAKDRNNNLWLSTNKGLSMFEPVSETFVNYSINDGLVGNQFNFKSGVMVSNGIMYFGAVNGLTYFDPQHLQKDNQILQIHFTGLRISNNAVQIGKGGILSSHIDFQDEILLKYKHKVFTIDFIALNYRAPKNIVYAYFLEGLEKDWNYIGNYHSATYTNLSPGKYVLHVRASNDGRFWPENERTIKIKIDPPFWMATWAYILYGVLIILIVFLIFRFYHMRQKEKLNIKLANMEKQKNEVINRNRLNFFTYISHEFKTPLTLIIATLEEIMDYEDMVPKFKGYGTLIKKNAMRLLLLINQLMDFRKIESDHASIKYNKGEIVGFIKSIFRSFEPLMKKRQIKNKFISNTDSHVVYFDEEKLEKILANIIGNSCKYCKDSGTITVDIKIFETTHLADPFPEENKRGTIIISIIDDGPGFPIEKLKSIFEPFELNDSSDIRSSGIGLALANNLVKCLGGKMDISNNDKGGASVTIQLPLVYNPSPEQIKDEKFIDQNVRFNYESASIYVDSQTSELFDYNENGPGKKYMMMVVEDNKELASFIAHHFSVIFKVKVAYDGEDAFEKIKKLHPDIVISDIMMPRIDGFTLCSLIKESIETSHIPVILLTAKVGDEFRIDGFYKGADAYIEKPFNLKELDLIVRNILRSKEKLRKHFATFDSLRVKGGELGNKDQVFIKKLTETVYKYLDDGNLGVETLCKEVNVSRTLLHVKLKKIAGLSSTEFINNIRLNEAKRMLQEGNFTISEIAYKVGYNDPAYFSKSFKKLFGKAPSEIRDIPT